MLLESVGQALQARFPGVWCYASFAVLGWFARVPSLMSSLAEMFM